MELVMTVRRTRRRWLRVLPTATLTVVPFVVVMPKAQAFFPPIGSGGTNPSNPPPVVVVPPTPPDPFKPPVVVVPPVVPPPVVVVPPPPHCVPEPSTLVAGLIGLAAAGIARSRKKKDENQAT
jgi:hypothetical protein